MQDTRLEKEYQRYLIKLLNELFPGCLVLKNDSGYLQGIPDLVIFYHDKWAMLEVKAAYDSAEQPNQSYYIDMLDRMSFAAFIYPENEQEVLDALQRALKARRSARVSRR